MPKGICEEAQRETYRSLALRKLCDKLVRGLFESHHFFHSITTLQPTREGTERRKTVVFAGRPFFHPFTNLRVFTNGVPNFTLMSVFGLVSRILVAEN